MLESVRSGSESVVEMSMNVIQALIPANSSMEDWEVKSDKFQKFLFAVE
jgi:hypothetical protein